MSPAHSRYSVTMTARPKANACCCIAVHVCTKTARAALRRAYALTISAFGMVPGTDPAAP